MSRDNMIIRYAKDIVKDIDKRGPIVKPRGYVTGEAFEEWMIGGEQRI